MSIQSLLNTCAVGGESSDPYFKNVVMLLNGDDGTNGSQNNTYVDSSPSPVTVTRYGNSLQGTFSPYGQLWSTRFSSSSWARLPANGDYDITGGDWTIELWINTNTLNTMTYSGNTIATNFNQGVGWSLSLTNSGDDVTSVDFQCYNGGWTTVSNTSINSTNMPKKTWHHLALVRSGSGSGNLTMYLNGVATGGTFNAPTYPGAGGDLYYGVYAQNFQYAGNPDFFISNFRLLKGTALYTSNFTPSTAPLTAISNTKVLTFQDSRFVDNSSLAAAFTIGSGSGSPSTQRYSPFNPTKSYRKTIIGGSAYTDGVDDYVVSDNNAAFTIATGLDFTLEGWVYPITMNGAYFFLYGSTRQAYAPDVGISVDLTGGRIVIGGTDYNAAFPTTMPLNCWNHWALVRSGGGATLKAYLNGKGGSGISAAGTVEPYTQRPDLAGPIYFNSHTNVSNWTQYNPTLSEIRVSDVRLVTGTAVYTGDFTPPTAPLTAVSNTKYLLNFTNAGIYDNAMMNNIETVGNAQISTSVKKYNTGSMYFDGTGDALAGKPYPILNFGSGNFTVEFWMYMNSTPSAQTWLMSVGPNGSGSVSRGWGIRLHDGSTAGLSFVYQNAGTVANNFGSLPSATTWAHIAFSRSGSTMKCFVNGTQLGSTWTLPYSSIDATSSTDYYGIGGFDNTNNGYPGRFWYNGYIDDLRLSNGVARYTANFTPPTKALPLKGS